MKPETIEQISAVAYMATRAFDEKYLGDYTHAEWGKLKQEQKDEVCAHVLFRIENYQAPPSAWHDRWMVKMLEGGYRFGPATDHKNKISAMLKPFSALSKGYQEREVLFMAVVDALSGRRVCQ